MGLTIEQLEQRIQQGWEKYPTPRPYISVKRSTYVKLKTFAVFIDAEFGEWEALPDGVMRGGMHHKRRQADTSPIPVTKEEFYDLYIAKNLSVSEIASMFSCNQSRIITKIREFDLKKPMALKLKLMAVTNQERYGCDSVFQNSEIRERARANIDIEKCQETYKATMLERYGVPNGFMHKDIIEKSKNTMVEKYGTPHALQSEVCRTKFRETIRKKYDDESLTWVSTNIKEIRDKIIATNKENLGVEFPFQSNEIQEKVTQSVIEKYGVDRIGKSPLVQHKIRKSILDRFGVHHLSSPDMRERIKETSLERYGCVCSLQNPEIAQKSYETKLKNESFNTSAAEKEIRQYVQSLISGIRYNVRDIIAPYELDIVVPEKRIAVEYNGFYWHSEAWHDEEYHLRKLKRCIEVGYRLVTIFENDWAERQMAVKGRLRSILGCNSFVVKATEAEVSIASNEEINSFLNEFHVQGTIPFEKSFKLTIDNSIVAVMTFSCEHNSRRLVLSRLCMRGDYTVIGAAKKLLDYASIKEPVIAYSDNRWPDDAEIYQQLNFQLEGHILPECFHVGKGGRVYDCGKEQWRLG
jgi:G:T-mismatch repair DNA endonuclease (very short patch repair protein)